MIDREPYNYEVLEAYSKSVLAQEVRAYMKKGWRVCGGVSCAYNQNTTSLKFFQAMVRSLDL